MPLDGDSKFKKLKKAYSKGCELRGKTLGIIGFGGLVNLQQELLFRNECYSA